MKEFVVLGLGSNRAWNGSEPVHLLKSACVQLNSCLSSFRWSSVYRTKPMYVEKQDDFFNMVVCGYADSIEPEQFLDKIHSIEASLGRDRKSEVRNGPRSLDIDIELFGTRKLCSDILQIPHPRISERAFVLVPLLELLSQESDIIDIKHFASALEKLSSSDVEKIISAENFIVG